jgi:hypothetical protein
VFSGYIGGRGALAFLSPQCRNRRVGREKSFLVELTMRQMLASRGPVINAKRNAVAVTEVKF